MTDREKVLAELLVEVLAELRRTEAGRDEWCAAAQDAAERIAELEWHYCDGRRLMNARLAIQATAQERGLGIEDATAHYAEEVLRIGDRPYPGWLVVLREALEAGK